MHRSSAAALVSIALLLPALGTRAQERHELRERGPRFALDGRYHHDVYYPARGEFVGALPAGSVGVAFHGGSYYYHGGVWFRPSGGRFVVIAPPFGAVVPVLPPAYATLWIGGAPYYYANGVYYAPAPSGYTVVAAPPGADTAEAQAPVAPGTAIPPGTPVAPGTAAPPGTPVASGMADAPGVAPATPLASPPIAAAPATPPVPIVYPRNGQSAAQTQTDQQECNRWATTQPQAVADASVFQRAAAACLDGRGYTVR